MAVYVSWPQLCICIIAAGAFIIRRCRRCFFWDACVPTLFASFVCVQGLFFLGSLVRPHCIGLLCHFHAELGMSLPGEIEDNILVVFQHFCIFATGRSIMFRARRINKISQGSVLFYLPQWDSVLPCVCFGWTPQILFWLPLMHL